MSKFLALSLVYVAMLATNALADDLFSRTPLGSPFSGAKAAGSNDKGSISDKASRILSADHLAEMLRDAQLSPKVEADDLVSLKFKYSKGELPAAFTLTDNNTRLWMVFVLAKLEKDKRFTVEQLAGMLTANRDLRPAIFALADGGRRLELHLGIPNEQISPKSLRDNLQSLASVAENTAQLWETAGGVSNTVNSTPPAPPAGEKTSPPSVATASPPEAPTNAPAAAPATPAKAPAATPTATNRKSPSTTVPSNLVGKWSALVGDNEALALQINAEGAFVIAHLKDGKTSRSTGTLAMSGTQLSLSGTDGFKMAGKISKISADSFDFSIQAENGSAGNPFTFKRAK